MSSHWVQVTKRMLQYQNKQKKNYFQIESYCSHGYGYNTVECPFIYSLHAE